MAFHIRPLPSVEKSWKDDHMYRVVTNILFDHVSIETALSEIEAEITADPLNVALHHRRCQLLEEATRLRALVAAHPAEEQ